MENQGTIRPGVEKYKDGGILGNGKTEAGILKRHIKFAEKACRTAYALEGIFIALGVIAFIAALYFLNVRNREVSMAPTFAYLGAGCISCALFFYFIYRYFAMKHEQYLWEEYQWYISLKVMSGKPLTKGELIVSTPVTLFLKEETTDNETSQNQ